MEPNCIEHNIYKQKKWKKKIAFDLLRKKKVRKQFFQSDFFYRQIMKESPITVKSMDQLMKPKRIILENYFSRNGNLTAYELMVIASIIAEKKPNRLLEIGTFDGNTTLQMALNAPEEATIHTLDLPEGEDYTVQPVLSSDLQFIRDKTKHHRKFLKHSVSNKIIQHFGDSTEIDFTQFSQKGLLDFIFIDGGHSYPCVKSDTENAFRIIQKKGCILWHDFTPHFGGVFQFLCELSKKVPLVHIEGTNFVFYEGRSND